jgi:FkbM family methyltransferase
VLSTKRVVFTHKVGAIRMLLLSNLNDDLFGISRTGELGRWEPESLKIWSKICAKSESVIDAGAYSGIYSMLAGKQGVKTVYSVEPNLNSAIRLSSNLRINRLTNVKVVTKPLDAESGVKVSLYVPETSQGFRGNALESSGARYFDSANDSVLIDGQKWSRIAIQETIKLDEVVDLRLKIGGLKIDAEGMELRVLQGATQVLRMHKPHLIIETWSESVTSGLNNFLNEFGYLSGVVIDDSTFNLNSRNLYFNPEIK